PALDAAQQHAVEIPDRTLDHTRIDELEAGRVRAHPGLADPERHRHRVEAQAMWPCLAPDMGQMVEPLRFVPGEARRGDPSHRRRDARGQCRGRPVRELDHASHGESLARIWLRSDGEMIIALPYRWAGWMLSALNVSPICSANACASSTRTSHPRKSRPGSGS